MSCDLNSTDISRFVANMVTVDDVVNSSAPSVTTPGGNTQTTLAGYDAEFNAALSDITSASAAGLVSIAADVEAVDSARITALSDMAADVGAVDSARITALADIASDVASVESVATYAIEVEIPAQIARLGLEYPPIPYTAGLTLNSRTKTYSYLNVIYIWGGPLGTVTSGTFNEIGWQPVQGDIELRSDVTTGTASIRDVKHVADVTALRALVGAYDGQQVSMASSAARLLRWDAVSTLADNNSTVFKATAAATGRWIAIIAATDASRFDFNMTVFSDFRRNQHSIWEQYGLTPKQLTDIWTTTRTGNATYNSPVGIKSVVANTARIEYDTATGEARGLLCEAARTRLNTISAVVTAPENVTVTAAAHTMTFYGTGTVALSGAFTGSLVGTGADNRVTLTFTPTAGTLTITPTGTVTRLQIELGADATSLIQGEGAAQTRPVSQYSRSITELFNKAGSTIVIDFRSDIASNGNVNGVFGAGASTSNALSIAYIMNSGTGAVRVRWYAGGAQIELTSAASSAPRTQMNRAVISFNSSGTFALAVNGVDVGTATSDNPNTAAWTQYWLGALRSPTDNPIPRATVSQFRVIPRWINNASERAELSRQ